MTDLYTVRQCNRIHSSVVHLLALNWFYWSDTDNEFEKRYTKDISL